MNTKKALWLKRPRNYITTDLHSFSWLEDDKASVFWTIGEEGDISLTLIAEEGVEYNFILLHTPSDLLSFSSKGINSSFFGLDSFIPATIGNNLKMEKRGKEISFIYEGNLIYKIVNPAFLGSASFGVETKGKGEVSIKVF